MLVVLLLTIFNYIVIEFSLKLVSSLYFFTLQSNNLFINLQYCFIYKAVLKLYLRKNQHLIKLLLLFVKIILTILVLSNKNENNLIQTELKTKNNCLNIKSIKINKANK